MLIMSDSWLKLSHLSWRHHSGSLMAATRTETTHGRTSSMAAARDVTVKLEDAHQVGTLPGKSVDIIVCRAEPLEGSCIYSMHVQLYRLHS